MLGDGPFADASVMRIMHAAQTLRQNTLRQDTLRQETPRPERPSPPHSPAPGIVVAEAPLQVALRQALRSGAGRVALCVTPGVPHHRRVARALLLEGAQAAGGQVVDGPGGDLLLIGAEERRARRLRTLLDRLLGGSATVIWSLDRDLAALRHYAAEETQGLAPDLAGLDAWIDAVPFSGLIQRGHAMRPALREPAFLRVEIARAALRDRLGGLGADTDLLRHAAQRLSGRLLYALADPGQARAVLGPRASGVLHLAVPPAIMAPGGEGHGGGPPLLMATLTVEELADPPSLALRRAALAARGWGVELDGLDATLLPLLSGIALPADLLRLHWSPELAAPAATLALRRIDPARVVLAGVDSMAALDWARGLDLGAVEGVMAVPQA